ncbi:MAG: hypothetical protein LBB87_05785 [Nitrososphaerota archaeon]|nr:hypothetical protein [Nitrososphaerota archaeon]
MSALYCAHVFVDNVDSCYCYKMGYALEDQHSNVKSGDSTPVMAIDVVGEKKYCSTCTRLLCMTKQGFVTIVP